MNNKPQCSPPGVIIPGVLYRLDEAKLRMGWQDAAFRAARRAGLKTYSAGKRLYLLGSDIVDFVTSGRGERKRAEAPHSHSPQPEKVQNP